jgi:hypothetical protein
MIVLVFQKCMKMQINGQTDGPSSSLRQNWCIRCWEIDTKLEIAMDVTPRCRYSY